MPLSARASYQYHERDLPILIFFPSFVLCLHSFVGIRVKEKHRHIPLPVQASYRAPAPLLTSMPKYIYPIPIEQSDGRLLIVRRPRGGHDLGSDMKALRHEGVDILVSLLERRESLALGLEMEEAMALRYGMRFINLPVPDYSVPAERASFNRIVLGLADAIGAGSQVAVHCHMSIGRSSLLAISILRRRGMDLDDAIALVQAARGARVPETGEQLRWLQEG